MSDPITPAVVKKLLSLDSPVAIRIFDLALLVGLIFAAVLFVEHHKESEPIRLAAVAIGMLGGMIAFMMFLGLFITVMDSLPKRGR